MTSAITTYTGIYDFDDLDSDFSIVDIAHALSLTCRFGGHCKWFYSVGEHSLHVSSILENRYKRKDLALTGLLHDATETFMQDLTRPFKKRYPQYKIDEEELGSRMAKKLGFQYPFDPLIKEVDNRLLISERNVLFSEEHIKKYGYLWPDVEPFKDLTLFGYEPSHDVEATFIDRYKELTDGKV